MPIVQKIVECFAKNEMILVIVVINTVVLSYQNDIHPCDRKQICMLHHSTNSPDFARDIALHFNVS